MRMLSRAKTRCKTSVTCAALMTLYALTATDSTNYVESMDMTVRSLRTKRDVITQTFNV